MPPAGHVGEALQLRWHLRGRLGQPVLRHLVHCGARARVRRTIECTLRYAREAQNSRRGSAGAAGRPTAVRLTSGGRRGGGGLAARPARPRKPDWLLCGSDCDRPVT